MKQESQAFQEYQEYQVLFMKIQTFIIKEHDLNKG
jgi:hypothetical protein